MWVFHYLLKSTRLSLLSPASFHILIYIFRLFLFDRWCWDHMKDLKTEEKKMLFETYQWIGFYMITASVLKGLTNNFYGFSVRFPRHWSLKIDSLNWLVNLLTKTATEGFYKKRCSEKFRKFTGKHLCQGVLFNKVASLRDATLLKQRLCHRRLTV